METTVSDEFKAMCKSNTPSGAIGRIKVIEDDITIAENTDIQNISIEDNCYVNDKFIGTTVAKKVTVNLFNDDNIYDLENKEIEAKLGFDLKDGEELVSYGNFIIEKPNTEEVQAKTNFIGYDYMIKFNVPFVDNNTYPVELGTYFSNLCTQVGLVAGNTDFINSDYLVKGNPFTNNEDCRTVLSAIAQIAGGIAKIGRDNKVYIINLSKEDALHEIDGNNYDTFTPNKVFGPVNKIIIKMNSGVDGEESVRSDEESITQNGECAITISDNPILNSQEERELVIDNIFNAIKEITYLPFKTTYYGYPYADSTDKAKISNVNDTEYNSYIFNHTISYDGSFSGSIETSALTKTQSMYKNTLDLKTRFRHTELAVDKINGKITSIIEQQEGTQSQMNSITQDLNSTVDRIAQMESETNSTIEELRRDIHGVTNTITENGGNNLFYYDEDFWKTEQISNLKEIYGGELTTNTVSGRGYLINTGSIKQNTTNTGVTVLNGTYTISFKYKKAGASLANASVKINGEETILTEDEWTDFTKTIEVNSNYIEIEFITDQDNVLYVADLMGNAGEEAQIWTQNPNETRTETVKIGKGIEVSSSTDDTKFKANADGVRIVQASREENIVARFTKDGTETKDLKVSGKAQIVGLLIQQVGNQTWISSLL